MVVLPKGKAGQVLGAEGKGTRAWLWAEWVAEQWAAQGQGSAGLLVGKGREVGWPVQGRSARASSQQPAGSPLLGREDT